MFLQPRAHIRAEGLAGGLTAVHPTSGQAEIPARAATVRVVGRTVVARPLVVKGHTMAEQLAMVLVSLSVTTTNRPVDLGRHTGGHDCIVAVPGNRHAHRFLHGITSPGWGQTDITVCTQIATGAILHAGTNVLHLHLGHHTHTIVIVGHPIATADRFKEAGQRVVKQFYTELGHLRAFARQVCPLAVAGG